MADPYRIDGHKLSYHLTRVSDWLEGRSVYPIAMEALYGFPESHAASLALLVYASAYLKVHYPAAFFAALLNNQPMGFYHPATIVKDAQRRGVQFAPIDVRDRTGCRASNPTGGSAWACATSRASERRWGR